ESDSGKKRPLFIRIAPPLSSAPAEQPKPKESEVEQRLRKPISLGFRDVPLRQVVRDLTNASGVPVVLDEQALRCAAVNLDAPLSIEVDNIDLKSALKIVLDKVGLRFIVEDDAIKITVPDRGGRKYRASYNVADLVDAVPAFEGQKPAETNEAQLMKTIMDNVAKN